ncbi:hypothetical protein AOQ84DRAFT_58964 [Glonium stellatum]|uniref:Uncharacterized protein n=1 Tax=Glonium stellatum TaxID=574774 RepID=A0A8E2EZ48_9PEZI|nr:hypothetical protein AOQ84DRAFT_58964 [Glonium stellatum]
MQLYHDGRTKHAYGLIQLTRAITVQAKDDHKLTRATTDDDPQPCGSVSVSLLLAAAWRRLKESSKSPATCNVMDKLKGLMEKILDTDDFINAVFALPIYYAMALNLESRESSDTKNDLSTNHWDRPDSAISIPSILNLPHINASCLSEPFSGISCSDSFSSLSHSDIRSDSFSNLSYSDICASVSSSLSLRTPSLERQFPCGPGRPINLWSFIE